jgi:hypothetical protein
LSVYSDILPNKRTYPKREDPSGRLWKESMSGAEPPKGASGFKELAGSLKRYPDTNPAFFFGASHNSGEEISKEREW